MAKTAYDIDGIRGLSFAVTGRTNPDFWSTFFKSRDEIKDYLQLYGATMTDNVTKATDYLVMLYSHNAEKQKEKAEALGIPILSEKEFALLIGKRFSPAENMAIPAWITFIPKDAFTSSFRYCFGDDKEASKIKTIELPSNVVSIDESAFRGCTNLSTINIPDGVKSIGDRAFEGCKSLVSIHLPESIETIGDSTFEFCESLKIVTLPKGLKRIGDNAFQYCRGLQKISLPEGLKEIGKEAFADCVSLQTVTIPNSLEKMGYAVYRGCIGLNKVMIPSSATAIAANAFRGCKYFADANGFVIVNGHLVSTESYEMDQIAIPDGVTHIGNFVFCLSHNGKEFNTMKELSLPDSLKSIGKNAFEYCKLLSKVIFPDGLKEIGETAFLNCKGLKKVWIPASVELIGQSAFMACSRLHIYAPADSYAVQYAQKNGIKFTACDFETFKKKMDKEKKAVPSPQTPTEEAEENISEFAIEGNRLTGYNFYGDDVVIPDNVRYINSFVFSKQTRIRKVTIPETVSEVGMRAFRGCTSLEEVIIKGDPKICEEAFAECTSLKCFSFPGNRGYTSLPEPGMPSYPQIRKVGEEKFRNVFNRTPVGAFAGCVALEQVHLPKELYTISRNTFVNCSALKHVEIPPTVRIIEGSAFNGCTSLESVDLPDGLDMICDRAFVACSRLRSITIPANVRVIEDYAFSGCSALKTLTIQCEVKEIPRGTFAGTDVEEVTIPEGVHELHSTAFSKCPSLKKITILGKDTKITDEYRWEGSTRIGHKQLPSETGFSNKEILCIVAPHGSLAEEYANHYGIMFTAFETDLLRENK